MRNIDLNKPITKPHYFRAIHSPMPQAAKVNNKNTSHFRFKAVLRFFSALLLLRAARCFSLSSRLRPTVNVAPPYSVPAGPNQGHWAVSSARLPTGDCLALRELHQRVRPPGPRVGIPPSI